MIQKAIKVHRHVTAVSEVDLLVDTETMTDDEALTYVTNTPDLEWDEVETITHYKIVENYA